MKSAELIQAAAARGDQLKCALSNFSLRLIVSSLSFLLWKCCPVELLYSRIAHRSTASLTEVVGGVHLKSLPGNVPENLLEINRLELLNLEVGYSFSRFISLIHFEGSESELLINHFRFVCSKKVF